MTSSATQHRFAWMPWAGLALGLVGVLYGMIGFWVRGYDNYDRAAIFLVSAWLAKHYQPRFARLPDTPRPGLGLALVLLGAVAYLPPWFVFTQIGPRPIVLWWEAVALVISAAGVMLIRSGPNLLREARFLLIFPLFALPLPGRIQNPLHEIMQGIAADIGAFLLPYFGSPILERSGNRIILESGGIHIAEVCSGLYMIRTTLSLTALMAHWYKFNLARGLFLMAFSIPVIIFVNSLRVTAFGLLQEGGFPEWVLPGPRHNFVGYCAYIPGLLLVYTVAKRLRPEKAAEPEPTGEPAQPTGPATAAATIVLAVAALGAVALLTLPGVGATAPEEPDFSRFPTELGPWKRRGDADPPPDEEVQTKLTYNSALHRFYTSGAKDFEVASVWMLYWKSAMTVKDYHHPDICFISAGDTIAVSDASNIVTPGGRRIGMSYREFATASGRKYVVYWTQEGRRVWSETDEARAASFLFPFHWLKDRASGRRDPGQTDDRLVVLIGMIASPANTRPTLEKLAGRVADELYKICPWADPAGK